MSHTFQEKLDKFVENQRGQSAYDVQRNADTLAHELREYVPKERWGNIFKYIVAYALGIGLGHALAAALVKGVDGLAPKEFDTNALAESIEDGHFDEGSFNLFMTQECGIEDIDWNMRMSQWGDSSFENTTAGDMNDNELVSAVAGADTFVGDAFTTVLGSDLS